MRNERVLALENGLRLMRWSLLEDPRSLGIARVGVITFGSVAGQVAPLTEIALFAPPNLNAGGGGASLGEALGVVADCARREVDEGTRDAEGDYEPLVFIITDSAPTDDIDGGLAAFRRRSWGVVVACAAGSDADIAVLRRITWNVLVLDAVDAGRIAAFLTYVSRSVNYCSRRGDAGGPLGSFDDQPPPPPEIALRKL